MSTTSSLGTLLATRLDAVLGTTLAQHPTLLNVRPNQAAQPMSALHPQDSVIRRAPDPAADAVSRGARRTGADVAASDRGSNAPLGRGELPNASARAILSEPAKAILALLVARPDVPPAVRGAVSMLRLAAASTHLPAPGAMGTRGAATATPPGANTAAPASPATRGAAPAASATSATAAARAFIASDTGATPTGQRPTGQPVIAAGGTSAAAVGPTPGFSSPMAQAIATALARSVGESGIFYESHLSQLAFGQKRPETILREPQALLGRLPSRPDGSPSDATPNRGAVDTLATARADAPPGRTIEAPQSSVNNGPTTPLPPIPGIHADATALVRQQLEVLAHAAFQWQGQAWEGAPMQWEIGEHPEADGDAPATWSTRLRLELPRLGTVEARLSIAGSQLVLRLAADQSAEQLQASASALRERLSGAGLTLSELAIIDPSTNTATDTDTS